MKNPFAIRFAMFALVASSLVAWAQPAPGYKVAKTWKLGGDGGWDYLTVDSDGRRLSSRAQPVSWWSTRIRGVAGEIRTPGVHGVALTPEFGRGFIGDGGEHGHHLRSQVAEALQDK